MAGELDAKLWSELPGEVLDLVLRRLPLSSLCRFRAVCKRWNTLPTVRPSDPYLLYISRDLRHYSLYSPTANKWETLNHSFLPSPICFLQGHHSRQIERFCSDGGLFCFQVRSLERSFVTTVPRYFLVLCNPLTRRFQVLPSFCPAVDCPPVVDLVMYKTSGGYKIFVVTLAYTGQPGFLLRHFMYDSTCCSWSCTETAVMFRSCASAVSSLKVSTTVFPEESDWHTRSTRMT